MRAIRVSWKSAQRLLGLAHNSDGYGKEAAELESALKPKKFVTLAKGRRVAKRQTKRRKTAEIREAVMKRAGNCCEWCAVSETSLNPLTLDHVWGRARSESVDSTWALCLRCHRLKTDNSPSRRVWLSRFAAHCAKYGYRAQAAMAYRIIESIDLAEASARAGGLQ